jgi:type IV secretion system protein VirB11
MAEDRPLYLRQFDILKYDLQPIEKYLDDPDVTDIFAQPNGDINFTSFTKGKVFTNDKITEGQRERIIKAVATMTEIKINPDDPVVLSVIPVYNARFTGMLFPASLPGPHFTIRKRPERVFSLEEYLNGDRVSQENYDLIVTTIKERKNLVIGGSTGAGKTTLMNGIIQKMVEFCPSDRFLIVEDVPEIVCSARDCVMLPSTPTNAAEKVRQTLRETPDRVIFGELRYGAVANELLKSWNTGVSGSATTIHANTCASTILRLKSLLEEVRSSEAKYLSSIVHLIIHITRDPIRGPYIDEVQKTSSLEGVEQFSVLKQ